MERMEGKNEKVTARQIYAGISCSSSEASDMKVEEAGVGNMIMAAGLRSKVKAIGKPPEPKMHWFTIFDEFELTNGYLLRTLNTKLCELTENSTELIVKDLQNT